MPRWRGMPGNSVRIGNGSARTGGKAARIQLGAKPRRSPHHRDFWRLTEEALAWTAAHHAYPTGRCWRMSWRRIARWTRIRGAAVLRRIRASGARTAILSNGEPECWRMRRGQQDWINYWIIFLALKLLAFSSRIPVCIAWPRTRWIFRPRACLCLFESLDAFGARSFGFRVFWINRSGLPPEYELPEVATELPDLTALPDAIGAAHDPVGASGGGDRSAGSDRGGARPPRDAIANEFFRERRFIGSGDRRAVSDRCGACCGRGGG